MFVRKNSTGLPGLQTRSDPWRKRPPTRAACGYCFQTRRPRWQSYGCGIRGKATGGCRCSKTGPGLLCAAGCGLRPWRALSCAASGIPRTADAPRCTSHEASSTDSRSLWRSSYPCTEVDAARIWLCVQHGFSRPLPHLSLCAAHSTCPPEVWLPDSLGKRKYGEEAYKEKSPDLFRTED